MNNLFGLPAYHMVSVNLVMIVAVILACFFYRYFYPKKTIKVLVIILIISLVPVVSSFRKGDYNGGLLQSASFAVGFFDSLAEGNIVPRWAERLDTYFGYPAYIFMYHSPFYISSIFHTLGFNFVNSVKMTFMVSYILSGVTMWWWVKRKFDNWGTLASVVLYQFAPYRFIDMYFRLDIGESVAFVFMPLVFLAIDLVSEKLKPKYLVFGTISVWLLILSHPALSIATLGIAGIYSIFLNWTRGFRRFVIGFLPIIFGVCISFYYWFPIIYETPISQIKAYTNGEMISGMTFVTFKELVFSPYRWGLLFQGNQAELAFVMGYAAELVILVALITKTASKWVKFWLVLAVVNIVMMLAVTAWLWQVIPLIGNFQFSWRILSTLSLISAVLAGFVLQNRNKLVTVIVIGVAIFSTILNWGHRESSPKTISDKNLREVIPTAARIYQTGFPQALPIWVNLKNQWGDPNITKPIEVVTGEAKIRQTFRNSTKHKYYITVPNEATFKENTYYYPGWKLFINNRLTTIEYRNQTYPGVMMFDLGPGNYEVEFVFGGTTDRDVAMGISLVTIGFLAILIIRFQGKGIR